jgi:putative spermidine/putrescine transport system permease protein
VDHGVRGDCGYPVAYLLATATEWTRNNLILWVLMPFWTSFLVRTFAWIVLLGRQGTINDWLQQLGIVDAPVKLIYNFAGVMIGMVHALMPLAVVTMLAVMRNIDESLPKAASTLGARDGQSFWRVYFGPVHTTVVLPTILTRQWTWFHPSPSA